MHLDALATRHYKLKISTSFVLWTFDLYLGLKHSGKSIYTYIKELQLFFSNTELINTATDVLFFSHRWMN